MKPPLVVEVEIGNRCNLQCTYCPNSVLPKEEEQWIAPELFEQIVEQLAEMGFTGTFSFHLYNEPLLHHGLEDMVRNVREKLPQARPVLFTNGILLDNDRYQRLMEAGMARFIVTQHGNYRLPQRPRQTLQTPEHLLLSNRGGLLGKLDAPLQSPCYATMEMLIISCKGEVLHCFEDALKRRVMGNLKKQNIREIWFSDGFRQARTELTQGKRHLFPDLCALCDNQDYPMSEMTADMVCIPEHPPDKREGSHIQSDNFLKV
jgi:radical SAM protein with 4Fe4S-binding SPASM domain